MQCLMSVVVGKVTQPQVKVMEAGVVIDEAGRAAFKYRFLISH